MSKSSTVVANLLRSAVWIAAVALAAPTWAANQLNGIRLHDAPDSTRVVLDTSQASSYEMFTMTRPHRVVIDLRDTTPAFKAPQFSSRVVERIRSSARRKRHYRVVLDLRQAARAQELVLKAHSAVRPSTGDRPVSNRRRRRAEPRAG